MTEQHRRSRFEPCDNCAPAEVRALTPEREAEWRKDAETACQWITKHYRDTGSDNAPARILVLLGALDKERTARQQADERRNWYHAEAHEKAEQELADLRTRLVLMVTEANETHASSQAFSALRGELRDLADPAKEGRSNG